MAKRRAMDYPVYTTPRTFRNYDDYRQECARARGWNAAMAYIFGKEGEELMAARLGTSRCFIEPMYISPCTFRNYDNYRRECARARGWNAAMAYIFGEEDEK